MINDHSRKTLTRTQAMPNPGITRKEQGFAVALPAGTRLGEFEIVDLIGEGGFGIVYLAYDHSLDRHVALKEYMPSGLVSRTSQMQVTVKSEHHAHAFTAGLKSFVNEARMLAQFDSPALMKVHRFWEGNGTAYMVMPYYEGVTLRQALKEGRIRPTESWIRLLLSDLFDAIETIHRAQCFHRDIAPDNILLLKDGRPLLLDFGAARKVIGDLTQCLTVILKPGFAPIEQYTDNGGMRQGAWTDIYALAAVVYYLITGAAPAPSVGRIVKDELVPARIAGKDRYSSHFLAVIDKALSVKPEHRFQSIAELRHALDLLETIPRTLPSTRPRRTEGNTPPVSADKSSRTVRPPAATRIEPKVEGHNAPHAHSYWQAATELKNEPESATGKWLFTGLLLVLGMSTGLYWGTQHFRGDSLPPAPVAITQPSSTLQSSGSSDTVEEEPAPAVAGTTSPETPGTIATSPAPGKEDAVKNEALAPRPEQDIATPSPLSPEEQLWRRSAASDKASDYDNYLRKYPKGQYAPLARLRLESHRPAQAQARARTPTGVERPAAAQNSTAAKMESDEDRLWNLATSINQGPAYESYLRRYPQGRYAALAKDRLAARAPPGPPSSIGSSGASPAPETAAGSETRTDTEGQRQASIKPPDSAVPEPGNQIVTDTAPGPTREKSDAAGKKVLKIGSQTLIGNFNADPVTGAVSGTGRIVWANGDQFEGTLVRGMKEGKGQFSWHHGQRYNGDWLHDAPNGRGTIVHANGNRYQGEIKDGLPHGEGTFRFRHGDVYKGEWVRGKSHGQGRYTWANGDYWEGEFRDDQQTANGKMVFTAEARGK